MNSLLIAILLTGWRLYPEGIPLQTTVEHELTYTIDTVQATHWHKSGNKFYIITTDSTELWVDNVVKIKEVDRGDCSKRGLHCTEISCGACVTRH